MTTAAQLDVGQLAATIGRRATGRPRILVGIDGPGASGKSTLAGLLADHLAHAVVVHADDFYLPTTIRHSREGEAGALFDLPRLAQQLVIPATSSGLALRYQRYDWDRDSLVEWIDVPPGVPVVVEGVYCLQRQMRAMYTYTVFCRAEAAIRLRRGLARDGEEARAMWVEEWMPAEDRYVVGERPDDFADLVVDSSDGDGDAVRYRIQRWRDTTDQYR
jgi:uridine kinase